MYNYKLSKSVLSKQRKDSLFINHSKKTTLEYITCKKFDIDEINFYKEIDKLNANNTNTTPTNKE